MANALRNLQLFRNGSPIIGTMAAAKSAIEGAFVVGTLVLNDGEPISIRYQETANDDVKGLYGVAYVNGNDKRILWADSDIQVLPPQGQNDYIYVTDNGSGTFTVSANVVNVNAATGLADGLASAYDVQQYINTTIKDKFVKDGYVKHLGPDSEDRMPGDPDYIETEDASGDPYLVLVLEGGDDTITADDTKIYVNVKDMITEYTSGDGIIIEANGVIGVDVSRIGEIANGVVGNAVANLGTVTATGGNYFTEIRVNAVTGQLEAEEALLPSGGSGDYYEGKDIDFRIVEDPQTQENNTFIDTALDADIHVAGLTAAIGGVGTNDTFTAGMSLSDVIKKIFVKDVDVLPHNPDITFNISDTTTTYEYGSSVTKTMSVSNYKDGYFTPANSAYDEATFNANNNTTGGKKNAGCVQGTETFAATTGSVSGSTWTNSNLTSSTTLTANVPYQGSTVTPKTMANEDSNVEVQAGTLTKTKTITPYYRIYAGVISGTDFSESDFATVSAAISALSSNKYNGQWFTTSGYYMQGASSPTQTSSTSTGAYSVGRGYSLVVLTAAGKTVTATYDDNSSAGTFETQAVTRTIDGNTVNYQINWLSNVSSDAAMVLYNLKVQ